MKKVRITVKRIARYDDLMAEYENPIEHACSMQLGQCFVCNGWERPAGFCGSAWDTVSPFVMTLAHGGEDFYDGWMKNPRSAMISCNDGFRPVSFLLETMDENAEAQSSGSAEAAREESKMEHTADERDLRLLENDPYTFSVLRQIIGADCQLLLTDHKRLILCYSCPPYPVWIWTPDDASEEEMERAWQLAARNHLLDGTHSFNLKYGLADYFIRRSAASGKKLTVSVNLFAYDCQNPISPSEQTDGGLYRCTEQDVEALAEWMDRFHRAVGIDLRDMAHYQQNAAALIQAGQVFFWKNAVGNTVACCKCGLNGATAHIGLVYTRPEYRRKHYAQNLVYQVTMLAKNAGFTPMLYTDADYAASNACYEKIGYVLRGRLCTLSFEHKSEA